MIWWMLQNFVVTAILAGCVWAICRIGRIGPAGQHALWLVLLVKLITPPLISWPWAISHVSAPLRMSSPSKPHLSARPATPVVASVPGRALPPSTTTRSSDWISDWLAPTAASVWLSGGVIFILMQGGRIRRMLRLLRRAVPAHPELISLVEEAARRVRTRAVDTRVAEGIASPFVWCIHRPRLLWPAALSKDVPQEAIRGLLVHELAHIKRRDHWVGWLELAAGCLWWWNPLYWYIRRQLRENAELACDAWVVDAMDSVPGGRRAYAEALLTVCESMSSPMTAVGANTSNRRLLERRLTMILRERFPLRLSRAGFLIVALIAAATLPMWTLNAAPESPVAPAVRPRITAAVAPPAAQELPNDAEELLKQFEARQAEVRRTTEARLDQERRQLIERLQALQDTHTRAGRLDEAIAVRSHVRRLQGIAPAGVIAEYVDRVGQNIARNSDAKVPFSVKVIESEDIDAVSLPGGFFNVNTGLILAADDLDPKDGRGFLGSREVLLGLKDQIGETIRIRVKGSNGWLWGTDVYTLDSELGAAAVHAGLLQLGEEGVATIRILPGQDRYSGSLRNGVRSLPFDGYPGSYRIEGVRPAGEFGPNTMAPSDRLFFESDRGGVRSWGPLFNVTSGFFFDILEKRGRYGETLELEVTGSIEGTIWGNGVYTDDSDLGTAAVHAGLLKPRESGMIRVTILPGRRSYEGSLRNGVRSEPFGPFEGSYRIERIK